MTANKAGDDLALIPSSLLFSCKCKLGSIRTTWFTGEKQQWGLYQNKATSSLTAIQRPGHWTDNCKMVYLIVILNKLNPKHFKDSQCKHAPFLKTSIVTSLFKKCHVTLKTSHLVKQVKLYLIPNKWEQLVILYYKIKPNWFLCRWSPDLWVKVSTQEGTSNYDD